MIKVNLLPAGMRKRQGGPSFNADALIVLAGLLFIAAAAGLWGWVKFIKIPEAQAQVNQLKIQESEAKRKAEEAKELEKKVKAFRTKVDQLVGLVGRRALWAKPLDQFADLLGRSPWPDTDGVDLRVSCSNLSLAEKNSARSSARRGKSKGGKTVTWEVKMDFSLVGRDLDKRGDYIRSFYKAMKDSPFWQENGFQGDPDESYKGDSYSFHPGLGSGLGLVEIKQNMTRTKVHNVAVDFAHEHKALPKRGAGKPAGSGAQPKPAPTGQLAPESESLLPVAPKSLQRHDDVVAQMAKGE